MDRKFVCFKKNSLTPQRKKDIVLIKNTTQTLARNSLSLVRSAESSSPKSKPQADLEDKVLIKTP